MRRISSQIEIEASPARVWDVLSGDHEGWNPFIERIEGLLAPGERLEVKFRSGPTFKPVVTTVEPGRVLEWLGSVGIRGIFDGRHRFELTETASGTKLVQSEQFSGVLVPFMSRVLGNTETGFAEMNEALAREAVPRWVPRQA